MTYTTGELLGYAVAWKDSRGVIHVGGQARLIGEAEALKVPADIEYRNIPHFIIEVREAVPVVDTAQPEAETAGVLQ